MYLKYLLAAILTCIWLCNPSIAGAQGREILVLAPGAIKPALDAVIPEFEKKTGNKVKVTYGSALKTAQLTAKGEAVDVPILEAPYQDVLASGTVVASTAIPIARVSLGMAIKRHAHAHKPDISTPAALKQTLLAARSIGAPNSTRGSAAGPMFDQVLEKLGITAQVGPKIKRGHPGDPAIKMIGTGEVEVGVGFISEMLDAHLLVVGKLPKEVAPPATFVGFLSLHAKNPGAAKALLDYLASPTAAAIYTVHQVDPGR